jgi:hypothetical protein
MLYTRLKMSKFTWLKNSIPYFLLLLVPLVLIIPSIGLINFPPGGEFSDISISHLPNAEFIKHSILVDHQIPLWNPLIMSGYPFAGDPLSGLWYPPGWFALLFPLPFGINLITALHIGAGSIGLFKLLRKLSVRHEIAFIFGLTFALLPKIYAHYGAGHITYLYAVCLTPWLMWSEAKRPEGKSYFSKLNIVLSALIVLADMRWYPFALIAWWCIAILTCSDYSSIEWVNKGKESGTFRSCWRIFCKIGTEGFISLLIAAPLLLPFVEFLLRSTRIYMTGGENLVYSLPPARLVGLLIPPEGGFAEWIIYPGIGVIQLGVVSLLTKNRKIILPTVIFIVSLVWSLGSNVTIVSFIESLPVLNLIRVPPRIVFLGDIMAVLAAALTLDWILHITEEKVKKRIKLCITGTGLFIILFGAGIGILQDGMKNPMIRLLIFTPLIIGLLILIVRKTNFVIPIIIFGIILTTDLYLTDITLFSPSKIQKLPVTRAIEILKNDNSLFRVYSPTYSIGQEVAERYGIQLVQGVNPMQLESYVNYLEKATNIPYDKYSVIIPPLLEPNSEAITKSRIIGEYNRKLLSELGVKYMLFDSPLRTSNDWQLISSSDGQWLYINQKIFPRVVLFPLIGGPSGGGVTIDNYSPNEITISISAEGEYGVALGLMEINYPGWKVWVDGEEKTIKEWGTSDIFRWIELPLASKQVIFKYQPLSLFVGLFISGLLMMMMFFNNKK